MSTPIVVTTIFVLLKKSRVQVYHITDYPTNRMERKRESIVPVV